MIIRRDIYQIEKLRNNLLAVTISDKVQIDVDGAKLLDEDCVAISSGEKYGVVFESRNINSSMTGGALNYLATEAPSKDLTIACAILVNNLPIRLLAKVFIRYHKPPYPSQIFKDRESAEEWLTELIPAITA